MLLIRILLIILVLVLMMLPWLIILWFYADSTASSLHLIKTLQTGRHESEVIVTLGVPARRMQNFSIGGRFRPEVLVFPSGGKRSMDIWIALDEQGYVTGVYYPGLETESEILDLPARR
jgi:hypothetical protein